jgi:hypothetical protein
MSDVERVLRASEIGEYVFCHRAWWLHWVQGLESANRAKMLSGVAQHADHGQAIRRAERLQRAAFVFLVLAILLVVACLFVLMNIIS